MSPCATAKRVGYGLGSLAVRRTPLELNHREPQTDRLCPPVCWVPCLLVKSSDAHACLLQSYNAKAVRNGAINVGKKILASKMSKSLKAKVAGLSSVRSP